ncbi:hypothetical protein Tco_0057663 [Tanacetum coccineum]
MSTSNNSNQQTLAESGANERPPMLKKRNYIPWESRFRRFLDNKLEEGESMWNSIQNGPLRPMIPDPDGAVKHKRHESSSSSNTKDIYNQVDACKNAMEMLERIKKLMFGSDVTIHVGHSRLMDEFDKFAAKEGESLESVYELLTTLVNIMDRNNVCPISVSINTKVLNSSKAKKAAKNHDPLALIAHSNASSSQFHANSSYSPQPYYVTHPSSVVDYEDEYQGELHGDSQEDKLTTAMMLLAREITQKFSTPINNRPCTSSNTRNQAVIQDGRVNIQTKNAGYGGNGNKNAWRQSRNQAFNAGNGTDDSNQIIQRVIRERQIEQMLLAMKDKAGSNLNNEENDFMLDTSYGEETMEELTDAVMLTARIQPTDGNAETVSSYDSKTVSEVNASSKVHEQMRCAKRKTIIQTSDDDQIDSNIIFDDPYVENNGGTSDHDSNDHDEYHKIQVLAYDVQREAENQKRLNSELKKQKMLLQKELEMSGLGYKNPECLKKAIAAQPKMYDGEKLDSVHLKINSPDSEETLEDAEEIRLKMRNKMVQINYGKLNALYETFVPQQDFSMEFNSFYFY